jgi:hypothetical protein
VVWKKGLYWNQLRLSDPTQLFIAYVWLPKNPKDRCVIESNEEKRASGNTA